jgi:hypothetical protein
MYGIHSGFTQYLEQCEKGEKVIWDTHLKLLSCFSDTFSGNHNRLIFGAWTGMFELAFEFDEYGDYNHQKPVGIVFWCAEAQLIKSHQLLKLSVHNETIPAVALFKDSLFYLKEYGTLPEKYKATCALGYQFLRAHKIIIPKEILIQILSDVPRH